ncbi:MAG: aminotransferase class V-fold PLP-dependent enzyme [Halioglobus sp.]
MSNLHLLPRQGKSSDDILKQIKTFKAAMTPTERGKLSSTAFQGRDEMGKLVYESFMEFLGWNGLFTFQEPAAAQMENEVLDICVGMVRGGEQGRANFTSGGTESNFCGLHAMRAWAREHKPKITQPEIVAPYSTHSTVHKTAKYLDLKVVTVPQNSDLTADTDALAAAIGPNTIGIVGSAPNWPYGDVDPITRFGELALEHDLWLHVDACVGAYILPFMRELGEDVPEYDFTVPGVRSISGDLHKYGYAPKPCSTIMWRSQAEQAYHFMPITEWACGLYLSQSFIGSRPMGPVAGIWSLMHFWGREGYLENTRQILKLKQTITDQCEAIPGLRTWKTHGPLMMIAADDFNIELVVGGMEQCGWRLLGVNNPPAIHLTLDVMEDKDVQKFVDDLAQVCTSIRSGDLVEEGLLSYGGVGAAESAPKWLLSAVEIIEKKENG